MGSTPMVHFIFFFATIFLSFLKSGCFLPNFTSEERETFRRKTTCNFSDGEWIHDDTYPLYDSRKCPFLSTRAACQENGRPDSDYEKWRWQPRGCSIPRFNALDFLRRLRGKRMVMVGDSIMRNQWESLVCLLQGVLSNTEKYFNTIGPCKSLHVREFGASIEFCWAPMLVELKESNGKVVVYLDLIEKNAWYWRGADVVIFDAAHWFNHLSQLEFVVERGRLESHMNPMVIYEKALSTWANWVAKNFNPRKNLVIFRSMSPVPNRRKNHDCVGEVHPAGRRLRRVPSQMLVLEEVLRRTPYPVFLQDITTMTLLRNDGHPSLYANSSVADCSHWCLPGVPDIWNEMLGALLLHFGL